MPSDTAEMDGWEEILQIQVEHPSSFAMLLCVSKDGVPAPEAVRDIAFSGLLPDYLFKAILEQEGQFLLHEFSFSLGAFIGRVPPPRLGK